MVANKKLAIFNKLKKVYLDPKDPGSLGGVDRLYQRAKEQKITSDLDLVKEFLETQRVYSYHKQIRKRFKRNRTIVEGIDSQWQADLADVQSIAQDNDGMRFILTVIDVFSKFAWAVPVTDKSAPTMIKAFKLLFNKTGVRRPKKLQTDKGTEFLNKSVQSLLTKEYNIKHFTTMGETKAAIVERFNRTLKSRMWRYFTASNCRRFIEVLDDIVGSYNNSYHRSIRMKPSQVHRKQEPVVWRRLYGDGERKPQPNSALQSGDTVRIPKLKGDFAKGYEPNWTEEEFKTQEVVDKQCPKRVYKLTDSVGEEIVGNFYEDQLQKIQPVKDYIIEKRLIERNNPKTKEKEFFVKWEGWPEKFNSWISESQLNRNDK